MPLHDIRESRRFACATSVPTLFAAIVWATTAAPVSAQIAAGDAKAGAAIAQNGVPPAVAACATCHGANGEGSAAFPPLAGTAPAYLREQLGAFANGSRNQPVMAPIAKALSDKDKADVSAYYAGLPSGIPAASSAPQTPKPDDAGAWLVLRGRLSDGIPACASCHATNGAGVGNTFPAIAKLGAVYMQQQIDAWKNNSRGPGPLGLMQTIARKLSNNDVQAVADYYARQQPGKN